MNKKIYSCGIYKITNIINNKIYVGQSVEIERRWRRHKRELNKNIHNNIYLQRSWNKYGFKNFKFEIIETCIKEDLDSKERYWIREYKSNNYFYGYNQDTGGTGGKLLNDDVRAKIGARFYPKGRDAVSTKLSEEDIINIKKILYENILTLDEIANFCGVSKSTVSDIKKGRRWSEVASELNDSIRDSISVHYYEKHSRLNGKDIYNIKKIYTERNLSFSEIGKMFNVTGTSISEVIREERYADIKTPFDEDVRNKYISQREKLLTENQILQIKEWIFENKYSNKEIAEMYQVSIGAISAIKRGKNHKNIGAEFNKSIKGKTPTETNIEDIITAKKLMAKGYTNKEINEIINLRISILTSIRTLKRHAKVMQELNESILRETEKMKLNSKIEDEKILMIKKLFATTYMTMRQIGKETNVDSRRVSDILNGKIYIDIKSEYDNIVREKISQKKQKICIIPNPQPQAI